MAQLTTKFTMYSGLRTFGGVIFSICYGNDRVIFEFGTPFDPSIAFFDGIVEPRAMSWVPDLLKLGVLPKINGLYRQEDLGKCLLMSAEKSEINTAVFISHLHLDHMALMGTIAPQIPVFLHHNAQVIEQGLETIGKGIQTLERTYSNFVPDQPISVGEIEVTPLSCLDRGYYDFSYLITTPDAKIHWTGDLVLNGLRSEKTWAQIKRLKSEQIDLMLCDGGAFTDSSLQKLYGSTDPNLAVPDPAIPKGMLSTFEYKETVFNTIRECEGLCIFNFYQREMHEAAEYQDWAQRTNRQCVFEPDTAYLVQKFFNIKPNVFIPDAASFSSTPIQPWLHELKQSANIISADEIWSNPKGYLLQNSYPHILELLSLPSLGGIYLHEGGEPIGTENSRFANLRRIINTSGFHYMPSNENYFGHAYPNQVKYFVDQIDPKILIPCHTTHPERLLPNNGTQFLPELYQTYQFVDHQLVIDQINV